MAWSMNRTDGDFAQIAQRLQTLRLAMEGLNGAINHEDVPFDNAESQSITVENLLTAIKHDIDFLERDINDLEQMIRFEE